MKIKEGEGVMSKKLSVTDELQKLCSSLEERYSRWDFLKKEGGSDPNYPDGVNLNLVRNHILWYKGKIITLCEENSIPLPEIFNKPIPDEVPYDYMVKANEIKSDTEKYIAVLKNNKELSYINNNVSQLTSSEKEKTRATYVLARYTALKSAFENNDLVYMRCILKSTEPFCETIYNTAEEIRKLFNSKTRAFTPVQMSLF